jgi:hypothetical protein
MRPVASAGSESTIAAANVDPFQARWCRQPIEKNTSHPSAPISHIPLIREPIVEADLSLSHQCLVQKWYRQTRRVTGRHDHFDLFPLLSQSDIRESDWRALCHTWWSSGCATPNQSQRGLLLGQTMRRRELITLIGGAVAWPPALLSQSPAQGRRIGVLMAGLAGDPELQARLAAFAHGLQQSGWTVGQNLHVDYRWSSGDAENC